MSACVDCHSVETSLSRGTDGHFRKRCFDCGHVGGPYVSSTSSSTAAEQQSSLGDW